MHVRVSHPEFASRAFIDFHPENLCYDKSSEDRSISPDGLGSNMGSVGSTPGFLRINGRNRDTERVDGRRSHGTIYHTGYMVYSF